jgi:hypothetical protein
MRIDTRVALMARWFLRLQSHLDILPYSISRKLDREGRRVLLPTNHIQEMKIDGRMLSSSSLLKRNRV